MTAPAHPTIAAARCAAVALFWRDPAQRSATVLGLLTFVVTLALSSVSAWAADRVDLVRVDKSERRMDLVSKGQVLRTYAIALGANPVGHKQQQGDERTPEGSYVLDWRNPNSCCMRSLHISYPNAADKVAAKQQGVDPGGMIMIHGQPNGFGWWSWLMQLFDWTNGCIAVTDEDMSEIWDMVDVGTPIEIDP